MHVISPTAVIAWDHRIPDNTLPATSAPQPFLNIATLPVHTTGQVCTTKMMFFSCFTLFTQVRNSCLLFASKTSNQYSVVLPCPGTFISICCDCVCIPFPSSVVSSYLICSDTAHLAELLAAYLTVCHFWYIVESRRFTISISQTCQLSQRVRITYHTFTPLQSFPSPEYHFTHVHTDTVGSLPPS